ncbi:MAG: hypothetical protein JXA71_10785 [Chitinispirillaceae bacterium]|nr:hypothetical protein [Chitinispirillaceae bacterium]
MLKKALFICTLLIASFAPAVFANDSLPSFMLWGRATFGQVVSSIYETGSYDFDFEKEWLQNFEGGVRLNRQISPELCGRFHIGFGAIASTVGQKNSPSAELTARKFAAVLLDGSMLYSRPGFLMENDSLQVELGYFPFKYHPQAMNLGEYLFRTGVYPGVVVCGFEHANNDKPKLGGIHLGYGAPMAGWLKLDLLLNAELDMYPLHDLNLTGIATYAPHRVFTLGAGVEFARLLVLDERKTTPGTNQRSVDNWVGYIDPLTGDTTLYTFKGTKLMGRATLDLKAALEIATGPLAFFGREDLKVYGEAVVLGVKNYPGWYADRQKRMPVMFGINWPTNQLLSYAIVPGVMGYLLEQKKGDRAFMGMTIKEKHFKAGAFGIGGMITGAASWLLDRMLNTNTKLDLLAVEGEYYGSMFANSQEYMWKSRSPVPYTGTSSGMNHVNWSDSLAKTDDDWKWSVYASRKIGSHFRVSAQAASDHTPKNWYTPGPPSFVKYTEMVPRSRDWYWMTRVTYYF